jgi:hypothetical protein
MECDTMKPRRLPLSALITGLLAAPGMGMAPPAAGLESRAPTVQAFPAEMPGSLAEEMRRVARGEPLDAYGMKDLQRRMTVRVQSRLAAALARKTGPSDSQSGTDGAG